MLLFPWSPSTEAVSPFPETLTYFAMGVDRVCHGAWVDLTGLQKGQASSFLLFCLTSSPTHKIQCRRVWWGQVPHAQPTHFSAKQHLLYWHDWSF